MFTSQSEGPQPRVPHFEMKSSDKGEMEISQINVWLLYILYLRGEKLNFSSTTQKINEQVSFWFFKYY
jgi:hypothetical protein